MDIEPNRITSETMQQIKQKTAKDSVLASLRNVVASGWPAERKEMSEHLRQHWSFRDNISVYDAVANRSHQVIVPSSLWEEMLQKIHKAHQGVESSIRRACKSLLWPGMQAAIKEKRLSSGLCTRYVSERPQEPMKSQTIPIRQWSKNKCWSLPVGWKKLPCNGRPLQWQYWTWLPQRKHLGQHSDQNNEATVFLAMGSQMSW